MKRNWLKIGAILLIAPVLLGSLPACAMQPAEPYTLFVYMCGSDLESQRGCASQNIAELLQADIPDTVTVILETGGIKSWSDYEIPSDSLNRYEIKDGELCHLQTLKQASMGDPATLEDFIRWGEEKYPNEHKGLIFWDHGGGSLDGISFDENYDYDGLTLDELKKALSASSGEKWDFIGFDACLMATYETASLLSSYADTMVASEENEPAGGWDYKALAENVGRDSFYDTLLTAYGEKCRQSGKENFTLSVVDLRQFSQVQQAFDSFVDSLSQQELASIARAAGHSLSFGTNSDGSYTNLIDLADWAGELGGTELTKAIKQVAKTENGTYRSNAGGLSFYYPLHDMYTVEEYLPLAGEAYRTFLQENYVSTGGDWIQPTAAEEKDGLLQVTVSPDSVRHIVSARYQLFRIETEGYREQVFGMGEDTDVKFDGKNAYTVNFKGNWVTFGGAYLHVDIGEDTDEYTTFTSPIQVNGQESEMRFVYDKTTRTVKLQGYVPHGETVGRIMDFEEGDQVTLLYDQHVDYEENFQEGKTFSYTAGMPLAIASLPEGYYQYTALFYDVYGKAYQAGTAVTYFDGKTMKIVSVSQDTVDLGE